MLTQFLKINKQVVTSDWHPQGVNERKETALFLYTLSSGKQTDFHGKNCNYFMQVDYKMNTYTRKSVLKPSVFNDYLLEVPFQRFNSLLCMYVISIGHFAK